MSENKKTNQAPKKEPIKKYGYVINGNLRLRIRPNLDSDILVLMPNESKIQILSESGDFYKVKFGEFEGYCIKEFVEVK